MRGVTFRRDNPVRTRICLLTPLSGFCPDVYLGERPILGHSCPDLYPEYKRIVRGPPSSPTKPPSALTWSNSLTQRDIVLPSGRVEQGDVLKTRR